MDSDQALHLIETYGVPVITVLAILLGAFLVAGWASRIVRNSCEKGGIDQALAKFFAKMTRWAILILAAIFCLNEFGIDTASFAVVIGAAGLAISLAFQGTLANFSAGVMLLVFRPFKVGDVISVAGQTGKVDEVELFTTTLDTPDNRRLIIPNGSVFGTTIENITHHDVRRVDVAVGVDYSADIDATRRVLDQVVATVPGRINDRDAQVVLGDPGDSTVNWSVRVWAKTSEFWDVKQAATRAVKAALDEAGIGIPFPQMDVHVDQVATANQG